MSDELPDDDPSADDLPAVDDATKPDDFVKPGDDADDLAAVVPKHSTEVAIASLRDEGVYDDDRRVQEYSTETVALPVTDPPNSTDVLDVVRQTDPEPRAPDLETLLRERGWDDEAVADAPASWAVVGSVILVSLDGWTDEQEQDIGESLLELHGEADTVCAHGGVSGELRQPDTRVVAGLGDTETVHTEHGTRYSLDLAKVMFSPGNQAERARMGDVVAEDEEVLDMFAGIGYFTLPMARAGAQVTAVEKNPESFRFLGENANLNGVLDRVSLILGDCREVEATADRVVMGYYDAHEYLDAALDALEPGGILHLHEATPEDRLWERPVSRIREAAAARGRTVEILERRRVKSHSEGVWHVVVDARID
ncbi:class I SAM-dependent methyltransferase [Haloarchaeobius sp. TZWSO28]|uniref:class I SAM-dependent methyltransferase n=1 Tax=Haloarchaeobius sp. TZWSO28 TaxID=3446119 RepID=UPI003EBD32A6